MHNKVKIKRKQANKHKQLLSSKRIKRRNKLLKQASNRSHQLHLHSKFDKKLDEIVIEDWFF